MPPHSTVSQPLSAFFIFGGTSASQPLIRALPDLLDSVGFEPTVALYFVNAHALRTARLSYSNAFLPLGRVFLSATNPYLTARNQKPNSPSCKTPSRFTSFCVTILDRQGIEPCSAAVHPYTTIQHPFYVCKDCAVSHNRLQANSRASNQL